MKNRNIEFVNTHKEKNFDIVITRTDGMHINLKAVSFSVEQDNTDLIFVYDKSRIINIQFPADAIELTDDKLIEYNGFKINITESIF